MRVWSHCKHGVIFLFALLFEGLLSIFFGLFRLERMIRNRALGKPIGLLAPVNLAGKHPILLVHGLNMDDFCMRMLRHRLVKDDFGPVYILNLGYFSWTLAEHAKLLRKVVEEIHAKHGPMHILAHSMGGLVVRLYLQEANAAARVKKFVTVATPHVGTPVANLAWSVSGRQLIPRCSFFQTLDRPEHAIPRRVDTLFLWGNLDWIVPPKWSGPFQDVSPFHQRYRERFHLLKNHGHMALLMTKTSYGVIREFLIKN